MRNEIDSLRTQRIAKHALSCTTCKPNVARLVNSPTHLERQELLCAIEYCELRHSRRELHA